MYKILFIATIVLSPPPIFLHGMHTSQKKLSKDEKLFLQSIVRNVKNKYPQKTEKELKALYKNLKTLCKAADAKKMEGKK